MPDEAASFDDHFNSQGLLCAGRRACAYCNKCNSCSERRPGRPHADVCSTPTQCLEWICPKCTAWLRELDSKAKVRAAVAAEAKLGGPKKPQRKRRASI